MSGFSPQRFGELVPGQVDLVARGTKAADAFPITLQVSVFSTVDVGTGCSLPASSTSEVHLTIINEGKSALKVYSASGAVYSIPAGGAAMFYCFDHALSSGQRWTCVPLNGGSSPVVDLPVVTPTPPARPIQVAPPKPVSAQALALALPMIESFEGCTLTAHLDTVASKGGTQIYDIGYGSRTALDGTPVTAHTAPITQTQADKALSDDVNTLLSNIASLVTCDATDHQTAALASFAYNEGLRALASSALLKKFNAGDVQGAADEFPHWNLSAGFVVKGLVNRRAAERAIFLTPDGASTTVMVSAIPAPAVAPPTMTDDDLNAAQLRLLGITDAA